MENKSTFCDEDRLGDLSQFDGHTMESDGHIPYSGKVDCVGGTMQIIIAPSNPIDDRLVIAAPDLLAALKESRKEVEELRERISKVKSWAQGSRLEGMGHLLQLLEGKQ